MKKLFESKTVSTGLAIFSMLFGAGNLMYPLMAGMRGGDKSVISIVAFLTSAVLLPIIGLLAMIIYDGNYKKFFDELGTTTGSIMTFVCMMVIGPVLAIPRIVTLSHTMLSPFLGGVGLQTINPTTSFIFALFFLGTTFVLAFRENKIVDILGTVISPLLLASLAVIMVKGFFGAKNTLINTQSYSEVLQENLLRGYETLDLLGTIFFAAIITSILKNTMGKEFEQNKKLRMVIGFKAGMIGISLLALVYCGMGFLGAYYGHGLERLHEGDLFREISIRILGSYGALVIAVAVLMACFSTSIALGAVVGEYVEKNIFNNMISFSSALALILFACLPLSTLGMGKVLALTAGPLIYVGYPILITLTLCNIASKTIGFNYTKLIVGLIAIVALLPYATQATHLITM